MLTIIGRKILKEKLCLVITILVMFAIDCAMAYRLVSNDGQLAGGDVKKK